METALRELNASYHFKSANIYIHVSSSRTKQKGLVQTGLTGASWVRTSPEHLPTVKDDDLLSLWQLAEEWFGRIPGNTSLTTTTRKWLRKYQEKKWIPSWKSEPPILSANSWLFSYYHVCTLCEAFKVQIFDLFNSVPLESMLKFPTFHYAPERGGLRMAENKAVVGEMRMKSHSHKVSHLRTVGCAFWVVSSAPPPSSYQPAPISFSSDRKSRHLMCIPRTSHLPSEFTEDLTGSNKERSQPLQTVWGFSDAQATAGDVVNKFC